MTSKTRLNGLFICKPANKRPWQADVVAAVSPRHNLAIFDYDRPLAPQFDGIDVAIDLGGSMGTREMVDAACARSVKLWQIMGTGFDHFDLEYWKQKEMPVANCPGELTGAPLGECAMMFMLMLARGWSGTQTNLREKRMCLPIGRELTNLHLGLIGFGASARELATRARAFGMVVSAIDIRDISAAERAEYGLAFAGKPADMERLIADSDFLSLHLHLNKETHHIMNERRLKLMKPSACLINVARGALVDEMALCSMLEQGRLAGAASDVFSEEPVDPNHPLLKLQNFVATPHTAGVTDGTSRRRAECCAQNMDRIAEGLEPLYLIW
jgi:phosphoglycerate dehydrogenase-like enzyme